MKRRGNGGCGMKDNSELDKLFHKSNLQSHDNSKLIEKMEKIKAERDREMLMSYDNSEFLKKLSKTKETMKEDERLKEAIKHCKEVASNNETCKECSEEHYELMNWLLELEELRKFKARIVDAIFE